MTVTTDLITTVCRLRKSLRDVRDRAARTDPRWVAVTMAGMISGDHLLMVVRHDDIDHDALWSVLERRWPEVIVSKVGTVEPRSEFTVEHTVQLALQHRGIEPIRIIIPAQVRAGKFVQIDPMPMLF